MARDDGSERPKKKKRRVLRIVGLALGAPIVLVLLVLGALHTGPGQRWLTSKIEERVNQRLNGSVEIEAVHFALFGDIAITGVHLRDEAGEEVVKLDRLEVAPDWSELMGGTPALDRIVLSGLAIHLVQYEDGTSNLKKLVKPKPPEPESTDKPKNTRIIVRSIAIDDVDLIVDKPDGTRIALENFSLSGSLDAVPRAQTVKLDIPDIRATLRIEKPKDGLAIALDDITLGLAVDLSEGAGKVTLPPMRARVRITQKGAPERKVNVDLKGATLSVGPGELEANVDKLLVGALMLDSLEVHGGVADGALKGEQKVQLVGLALSADKLNRLLGKKLLASDVHIDIKLGGPPDKLALVTTVTSGGAKLVLEGDVDASDPRAPRYRMNLSGASFESARLVQGDAVPPVKLEGLEIGLRGSGASAEDVDADIGMRLGPLTVKKHRIDEVSLQARLDGPMLELDPLRVQGVGQTLWLRGTVDLLHKLIDATLTIEGDVGNTLERLRQAGMNVSTRLPPGALALREGVLTVHISGELEGLLKADVVIHDAPLAGGAVAADLHAELRRNLDAGPNDKKIALESVHGTVELKNVGLRELAQIRGKKLDGMTGSVSGKVVLDGAPGEPAATYQLTARAQPGDARRPEPNKPTLLLTAHGKASKHALSLDLDVTGVQNGDKLQIAKGTVRAPLYIDGKTRGLSPSQPLEVSLDVERRSLAELKPFLPASVLVDAKTGKPRELPDGTYSVSLDVGGTAAAPEGKIHIDGEAAALGGKKQKLEIDGTIASSGGRVTVDTDIHAWLDAEKDKAVDGKAHVDLSRSPLVPGKRELSWTFHVDAKPGRLEELSALSPKLEGLSGRTTAAIDLHGNDKDLFGTVHVKLDDVKKNGKGPIDADLHLDIADNVGVKLDAALAGTKVLQARGHVARSGTGLLAALRDKTPGKSTADKLGNPALAIAVEVPDHALASHARVAPALKTAPGRVGGRIDISGDLQTPTASGAIAYHHFETLSGEQGRAALRIDAGRERIEAKLELGPGEENAPVTLTVGVPREALPKYLAAKKCFATPQTEGAPQCPEDVRLPIEARASAEHVDVKRLVPSFALADRSVLAAGTLDWSLDGNIVLDPKPRFREGEGEPVQLSPISPESRFSGKLALTHGVVGIPGTRRRYHDASLRLSYDAAGVRIDGISLRESDLQRKNRKLDITGTLALRDFKPEKVDLAIKADQWLLFGQEKVGPADAPRGTLSADIAVKGKLDRPIKHIDVAVNKLELLIPDRFDRAHQPEATHLGDVIYLDETTQPPGKLPVPPREPEPTKAAVNPKEGMDIDVRIPGKVHVLQFPMNLYARGNLKIKRRGSERHINGKIKAVGGDLSLGGKLHALERGHIIFDDAHPGGQMDLLFARRETNSALRDISKASGGEDVKIHLEGPLNDRKTTLSGAGSPGTLFDLLSMHNAGRPRYKTDPDLPATNTVQYPQQDNLLLLSYLSVNVPNMLFLDKVAAWADAYDARSTQSYGQLQHYEAEGYAADGDVRVRMVGRPPAAGASNAEVQVDYMLHDTPQTAVGAGLSAGSRLGGGPGITFDWSSDD